MKALFINVWKSLTEVLKAFFLQLFNQLKTFKN